MYIIIEIQTNQQGETAYLVDKKGHHAGGAAEIPHGPGGRRRFRPAQARRCDPQ